MKNQQSVACGVQLGVNRFDRIASLKGISQMELFIGGGVGVAVVAMVIGGGIWYMRDRIAPIETSEDAENVEANH